MVQPDQRLARSGTSFQQVWAVHFDFLQRFRLFWIERDQEVAKWLLGNGLAPLTEAETIKLFHLCC